MTTSDHPRGFTLVELLVVVSIIGILATVVLASLTTARAQARDAFRRSSLQSIEVALEMYYSAHAAYPSTGGSWYGMSVNGGSRATSGSNAYIPGLTPDYLPRLPSDPSSDLSGWTGFLYRSDGTNYKLLSHANAPESFPKAGEEFYDPVRPTWAWMTCSAEPACSGW